MAADLGVGRRVRIGWTPDDQIASGCDVRFRRGTIVAGPYPPDMYLVDGVGFVETVHPAWDVDTDDGVHACVAEPYLIPEDDDDGEEDDSALSAQHRGQRADTT